MRRAALVFAMLVLSVPAFAAAKQVRVKTDRVILRIEPSFQGEVATQVDEGTILLGRERQGEWLQVLPPTNLFFWIHSKYVEEGVVTGSRVRVRLGPGVEYLQVAELVRGSPVVSHGEQNGWLKIVPPDGLFLWIHADLVEDPSVVKKAPPRPPAVTGTPAQDPVAPAEPAGKPESQSSAQNQGSQPQVPAQPPLIEPPAETTAPDYVARLGLVPLKGQGLAAEYEGYLQKTDWPVKGPTSYRLVTDPHTRSPEIVCYVMGNSEQLMRLQGSRLLVSGKEYWVRGSKQPLVVLERIVVRQKRIDDSRLSGRRDRAP